MPFSRDLSKGLEARITHTHTHTHTHTYIHTDRHYLCLTRFCSLVKDRYVKNATTIHCDETILIADSGMREG